MGNIRTALRTRFEAIGLGFVSKAGKSLVSRLAPGVIPNRMSIAVQHLHGEGLEIGALHGPIQVPDDVVVRYVDLYSRADNAERFDDLSYDEIIEPDYIEDGFELTSISSCSQDFVIASHVLEHSENPIQALLNWGRVTSSGGVLYVIVPMAAGCFDVGRAITDLDHLIQDQACCAAGQVDDMRHRNRSHYFEWVTISEPNIFTVGEADASPPDGEEVEQRVEALSVGDAEIHFHTFSPSSFRLLLDYCCGLIGHGSRVIEFYESEAEVVAVILVRPRRPLSWTRARFLNAFGSSRKAGR